MTEPTWAVVIPVKPLASAKTRLRPALAGAAVPLALAMARDTVAAVLACPEVGEVVVVTDDPAVGAALTAMGARIVPDQPAAGLNAAVRHGARTARPGAWVAALAADLPALNPAELAVALAAAAAAPPRGFVADAEGDGTTMLAAHPGVPLDPRFGTGSAKAHSASGAHRLSGQWPTLRRDVDTHADLLTAWQLGLGRYTAALVRAG